MTFVKKNYINKRNCKIKRAGSGIFYDSIQDIVYLGGGNNDYSSVEYYDLNKRRIISKKKNTSFY